MNPSIYLVCGQTFQRHGLASKTCSAAEQGAKTFYFGSNKQEVQTFTDQDTSACEEETRVSISFEFFPQSSAQHCLISKPDENIRP